MTTREAQPSNRSNGTVSNISVFNRGMEERAKQRELLRKEREEKKRKQEMERLELLRAHEEEKMRIEEEERRKKNEELKEKRRVQKELEDKRNAEKFREEQLNTLADSFYRKHLLRYYCFNGLKKLVEMHKSKMTIAKQFHTNKITGVIVHAWRVHTAKVVGLKQELADDFNRKRMLKLYFTNLTFAKKTAQIAAAKAIRHYKQQIKLKLFTAIKVYSSNEKMKAERNEVLIVEHNENRIKAKYLKVWREFPAEQRRLKEKQKRLDDLRSKVREMIPDYGD